MGLDRGPASSFELCCTLAIIPVPPCFWPSHSIWSQSLLISLARAAWADSQMEQGLGASLADVSWNLCRQNEMLPCRLPEFFSFPAWIFIRSHDSPLNISLSALLQRTPYGSGNSTTERENMEEMVHWDFLSNMIIISISSSADSSGPAGLLLQDKTPMTNGLPNISCLIAPLDHSALSPTSHWQVKSQPNLPGRRNFK